MTVDIYSKGEYPADVLSNFYPNEFEIDGVKCASMEGFLQSLKFRNPKKQEKVCRLVGKTAKSKGKRKFLWKITNTVYWQGRKIKRTGEQYKELLNRAYAQLLGNETFAKALISVKDCTLSHTRGGDNPRKTILTTDEFLSCLKYLLTKINL